MIGVPADRPRDVERDLREERQERRNLIAHDLGRMIMAVVHERNAFIPVERGIAQRKLGTPHCIRFDADAKHLGFARRLHLVKTVRLRKDCIDGLAIALAGRKAVRRNVLRAVARPDIHYTGFTEFLCEVA